MTATTGTARDNYWELVTDTAEVYERELVPVLFAPWADELVQMVSPRPGERVLDLACGTGLVARKTSTRLAGNGHVVGVDVNPGMLAVARRTAAGLQPAIEWRQADALRTGLPDQAFDAAFCQQGLQFFPDRSGALRELHRLLAPEGRVAVSAWCDPYAPGYAPLWRALERHHLPGTMRFLRTVFSLTDAEELRGLLDDTGFRDVTVGRHTHRVRASSAAAWVRAFLGAAPVPELARLHPTVRASITAEVSAALQPYSDARSLNFPISANVALARR